MLLFCLNKTIDLLLFIFVTEARARIIGASDLILKTGSSLTLTCVMSQGPHNLGTVNWFRGNNQITTSKISENDVDNIPRIRVDTAWSDALTSKFVFVYIINFYLLKIMNIVEKKICIMLLKNQKFY